MSAMKSKSCDIFFTRGPTKVARLIRIFTRRPGEAPTKINHTGLVTSGSVVPQWAMVIEAIRVVTERPLGSRRGDYVAIYRPINLSLEEKELILAEARKYIGVGYDYAKIATQLADWFLGGLYVFRRLTAGDRKMDCSYFVAKCFKAAGKDFGVPVGMASPDDIWDFVKSNPDKYQVVLDLQPLTKE